MASTSGETAPADPIGLITEALNHLNDLDHYSPGAIGQICDLLLGAGIALHAKEGRRAIIANGNIVGHRPLPASKTKTSLHPRDLLFFSAKAIDSNHIDAATIFLDIARLMLDHNIPTLGGGA